MMLFLKHIARAVRRAPLQPLLSILTVLLAVTLCTVSATASDMFIERAERQQQAQQSVGDLLISMRADSGARILFEEDAKALLGADGQVVGEFALTAQRTDQKSATPLSVCAADLLALDDFYRFSYTVYGSFHENTLDRTAILSASAARAQGLEVGDSFTLRLLERELTYTVGAIAADEGILLQRDVLVSIDGVIAALAERLPIIASLGDAFHPYTRLMIRLADGVDAQEVAVRFAASPAFADKQVAAPGGEYTDYWIAVQLAFVWTIFLLVLLLSAFLIGTSLTLLHRRRSGEYARFALAGATRGQIASLILLESMLYALAGAFGGMPLSVPIARWVGSFYAWRTTPLTVCWQHAAFGFAVAFLLMLLCTLLHLRRSPDSYLDGEAHAVRGRGLMLLEWLPAACALLLSLVLLAVLPVRLGYLAAIPGVLCLIWLLFVFTPRLLHFLAHRAAALCENRVPTALWMSLKNIRAHFSLRHAGRLLAVMLALLVVMLSCERALSAQVDSMTVDIPADMLGYGVSEEVERQLAADPLVAGVMRADFHTGAQLGDGATATAISVSGDVQVCTDPSLLPTHLPKGDELAVAKGVAALAGVKVGDRVEAVIGGVTHSFEVTELVHCNANLIYFDAAAIGTRPDALFVTLGEDTPAQRERITAILEADGAAVLPPASFYGVSPEQMSGQLRLLRIELVLSVLLCLSGVVNILVQQRFSTAHERDILAQCGMRRRTLREMALLELLLLLGAALVFGLAAGGALCLLVDVGLRSFGMLLFA